MKKYRKAINAVISLFLVLSVTLNLTGCGNNEEIATKENTEQKEKKKKDDKSKKEKAKQTSKESDKNKDSSKESSISNNTYDITISELKASFEEDMIRLDFECESKEDGEITLTDNINTNIGPIEIKEGSNTFYFLLSQRSINDFTMNMKSVSGKTAQQKITQSMIQDTLKKATE